MLELDNFPQVKVDFDSIIYGKKTKQKNMYIYRKMLRNHMLHWVHEGESWKGPAGCTPLAPLIHRGGERLYGELWVDVADITGTSLEGSEE